MHTIADVVKALAVIQAKADEGDDEVAPSYEDLLYESVLKSIADENAKNPRSMAEVALTSRNIKFKRWCA